MIPKSEGRETPLTTLGPLAQKQTLAGIKKNHSSGPVPGGRGERADDRTIGQALDDQTGGEGASRRATGEKICIHI